MEGINTSEIVLFLEENGFYHITQLRDFSIYVKKVTEFKRIKVCFGYSLHYICIDTDKSTIGLAKDGIIFYLSDEERLQDLSLKMQTNICKILITAAISELENKENSLHSFLYRNYSPIFRYSCLFSKKMSFLDEGRLYFIDSDTLSPQFKCINVCENKFSIRWDLGSIL